ncbi:MAG: hypothetical protein Kow0042_15850 [Calditrichia bacterium]
MLVDKQKSLKEAYANLLEVGFGNGSLDEISAFIDANVMGYGTARDEKILSIEGFRALVELQRQQAVNFEEFRFTSNPVFTRFLNQGETAVIADEIELITKINGESNTLFLRMTTVFEWRDGAWRTVHWHGSIPEHVSEGEDPWHVTEWQKKQAELEKQVAEKTADLLKKNQELEIEAALERVRTVAMGMSTSDDLLNICEVTIP